MERVGLGKNLLLALELQESGSKAAELMGMVSDSLCAVQDDSHRSCGAADT